jgi:hypothetical protein
MMIKHHFVWYKHQKNDDYFHEMYYIRFFNKRKHENRLGKHG